MGRSILVCLLSLLTAGLLQGGREVSASEPGATNAPPSFLYTVARDYSSLAWMHGGERFPSGATVFLHDARGDRPLVPDFAATADSSVSFDGHRVLFSAKQTAGAPWQVWEVALDGGEPRRVTSGDEDCIRPFYLPGEHSGDPNADSTEGRVAYARKIRGQFVIETIDLAGGKPLAVTYGPANYLPTDILRDGRILFETSYPLGTGSDPEVYTVYTDGSGVETYRCDHGKARDQAKQVGSGDIVFASRSGMARFTSARAQEMSISAPAGEYAGEIAETSSGDWLAGWRRDARSKFQLMVWAPGTATLRALVANRDADVIQPVLLQKRPVPNRHPSGLHDWPNANLLCLNAYRSRYQLTAGSVRSVQIYTRDGPGNVSLLGTAPVEPDGSFFVQVPTEQALQIELVDAAGKTLKRESGFFWMRRGEQRACVGCHAGPEAAPENAVPMILLRSTTPADMTRSAAHHASGGH